MVSKYDKCYNKSSVVVDGGHSMDTVNVSTYWSEKKELVGTYFKDWNETEQIQVRKLIVAEVMDVPHDYISYYLKRDKWLSEFVLGDNSELDNSLSKEDSIKRKVNTIIESCFYKEDYLRLAAMMKESCIENPNKNDVCNCIKKLLEAETYAKLTIQEKESLAVYEKIYFEQIELFNEYLKDTIEPETYFTLLLEQWKTANEMAANISAQRNNMNNFFVSMMSILIGGILFSEQLLSVNPLIRTFMYVVIMFMGVMCCEKWHSQIDNFGKMNGAKYEVINALERYLPANVLLYEYMHTEKNARNNKVVINFSKKEKEIVAIFKKAIIGVTMIMILSTWWENILKLWNTLQIK